MTGSVTNLEKARATLDMIEGMAPDNPWLMGLLVGVVSAMLKHMRDNVKEN